MEKASQTPKIDALIKDQGMNLEEHGKKQPGHIYVALMGVSLNLI